MLVNPGAPGLVTPCRTDFVNGNFKQTHEHPPPSRCPLLQRPVRICEPTIYPKLVKMSDDEYYDDEYADLHDMLYDADPDPDLADDLAEHAAHSPVYFDNPNEEAREYFSDWEYYSDDYFDDDPVLLSDIVKGQMGEKSATRNSRQPAKRGRKRKLSEARERPAPETTEMKALRACIQGTVWKSRSPELEERYKGGHSDRVALRLSKAIMKSAYSAKQGFGTGRRAKDESWANDLSLEDMGLRTETSMDLQRRPSAIDQEQEEEEEEEYGDENDEDENDANASADEDQISAAKTGEREADAHAHAHEQFQPFPKIRSVPKARSHTPNRDSDDEEGRAQVKRRKVTASESSIDSKNSLNTPETSLGSDQSEVIMEIEPTTQEVPIKRGRGRPKKQHTEDQNSKEKLSQANDSGELSRKRKLSHIESSATASTASSRAKRMAKSDPASVSTSTSKVEASKVPGTTRKTRSQKK